MESNIETDDKLFHENDDEPFFNRSSNVVSATLTIALAILIIVQSQYIGESGRPTDPGPGGYPTLLAILLILVAIPLYFQRQAGERWPPFKHGVGVFAALIGLIIYAQIISIIGYIAATALLVLFGIKVASPSNSWIKSILYAIIFSVLVYYIFYSILGVSLPRGDLERLLS